MFKRGLFIATILMNDIHGVLYNAHLYHACFQTLLSMHDAYILYHAIIVYIYVIFYIARQYVCSEYSMLLFLGEYIYISLKHSNIMSY